MSSADAPVVGSARVAGWVRQRAPVIVLAVAAIVMFAILLYVGRWLLFWRDEWSFVFRRPDPTPRALLAPLLDTFVAVPVLVYDALLAVFGLRNYLPYLLVAWVTHFIAVALLYRIVARRSGALLGLAAAISLLFLGSGFEVLLHPFQITYTLAVVGGLLAIDQIECRRVAVAAVALVVAVASSGLGVIFTGLVLLWGLLDRDRSKIVAVVPPIAIYAAWYFTWGRESGRLGGEGLGPVESVQAVLFGMGAAVSGLVGLPPYRFAVVGAVLGAIVLVVAAALTRRGYRPDTLALAAIAALAAEHILQTIFRADFGVEHGARSGYVYPGVIFLWLAISGLLGRRIEVAQQRWPRAVPLVTAALLVPMVAANMWQFAGAAVSSRGLRATEFAELRLIESLRDDPRLALDVQPDDTVLIKLPAREYLKAIDRFGSPTLAPGWEADVDAAAVEAARRRLLPE